MIRIAHRGIDCKYPQNSLENLELAFQSDCDAVEIDVRSTKDGQLLIHHDGFWLYNGRFISAKNEIWDTIRDPQFAPQKDGVIGTIPTFADVYSLFKQSNKLLFLEMKSYDASLRGVDLLTEFLQGESSENIIISSFSLAFLRRFRERRKDFVFAKVGQRFVQCRMDSMDFPVQQIHFSGECLTEERMKYFTQRGLEVYAWTINNAEDFRRMEDLGVRGIFTDNLDGLNRYLGSKQ